jgi:hypothetical protein
LSPSCPTEIRKCGYRSSTQNAGLVAAEPAGSLSDPWPEPSGDNAL